MASRVFAMILLVSGCAPTPEPEGITFTRPTGGGPGVAFASCNMMSVAEPADEANNPTTLADRTFQASCTAADLSLSASTNVARTGDTLTVTEAHTGTATSRVGVTVPSGSARTSLPISVCGDAPAGKRLQVLVTLDGPMTVSQLGGSVTQKVELITPALERKTDAVTGQSGASVQQTYASAEGPGRQCLSLRLTGQMSLVTPILITGEPPATKSASSQTSWVLKASIE